MAKFLLFLFVLAVIYLLARASNRRVKKTPPVEPSPQAMAKCAHCGVHFPRTESVSQDGRDYCCDDHRRLGAKA